MITIYPPNTATNAAKHMLGNPQLLMSSLNNELSSAGMIVVTAESVAEKIVEEPEMNPTIFFWTKGCLKKN